MVDNSQGHAAYASDALLAMKIPEELFQNYRMAGSYTKDAELLSQWCFLLTTPHIQTNQKESNMCLLSRGYGDQGCFWNAKSPRSVQLIQLIAVHGGFFHSNPISWSRNPVFRKSLKLLGTCASFCLNSTVNSTLLSSSGVQ